MEIVGRCSDKKGSDDYGNFVTLLTKTFQINKGEKPVIDLENEKTKPLKIPLNEVCHLEAYLLIIRTPFIGFFTNDLFRLA